MGLAYKQISLLQVWGRFFERARLFNSPLEVRLRFVHLRTLSMASSSMHGLIQLSMTYGCNKRCDPNPSCQHGVERDCARHISITRSEVPHPLSLD